MCRPSRSRNNSLESGRPGRSCRMLQPTNHRMHVRPQSMAESSDVEALHAPFPHLSTNRLTLREIVASDASALLAIHGDREAMRFFGSDPISSLEQAEELVGAFAGWRQAPVSGFRWGIERNCDGRFVGTCGLFRWNKRWKSCTVGYELAQEAWGGGLMTEALTAALDWGFDGMELNRIEAQVHPQNVSSLKLLVRLGFVEEGLLRQAGFWGGEHRDLFQLALLRADHRPRTT